MKVSITKVRDEWVNNPPKGFKVEFKKYPTGRVNSFLYEWIFEIKDKELLKEAGFDTIEDLLQIFPSKIIPLDHSQKTSSLEDKSFFYGRGKIIKVWKTFPQSFSGHRKGKKGAIINAQFLYSGSGEIIKLMWFNAFPNLFEKIKVYEEESIFVYLKGFINLFNFSFLT